MTTENIEYALNQIITDTEKYKKSNEQLVQAIINLTERQIELIKAAQNANFQRPIADNQRIEGLVNSKFSEIIGVLKAQIKEEHHNTSYFLYPEGQTKKTLVWMGLKALMIIAISVLFYLSVRFVVLKIEDNSNNANYKIAFKHMYLNGSDEYRRTVEKLLLDIQNDSVKQIIIHKIDKANIGLK